jgi:hypothetical protein
LLAETVKVFNSADGRARVAIIRRADGFYEFVAEAEREIDGFTAWVPDGGAGIYDSAATALREAAGQIVWLRSLLQSN